MKRSILCRVIWENEDDRTLPEMDDLIGDLARRGIEYISSYNDKIPTLILRKSETKIGE